MVWWPKCCRNVMGILERQRSGKKLGNEEEAGREFTHLDDRVSAGGGCEAAVTA